MTKKVQTEAGGTDITDEMLEEYDFANGMRGKYAARVIEGSNVVILDSDVAGVFTDSESVNRALRLLVQIARAETLAHAVAEPKAEYRTGK